MVHVANVDRRVSVTGQEYAQDRLYEPINVRDAGAVGDGVTDDTAAIQAALTAAGAAGGEVFFPPGTYKITTALAVSSNTTVCGAGDKSVISISGNVNGLVNAAGVGGNTAIVIKDLRINGTGLSGASFQKGIRFDATTDFVIERVTVYNVYLQGINVDDCDRGRIVNNLLKESWGNGISIDNGSTDIVIEGNNCIDCRDSSIGLQIRNRRIVVSNNTCVHTLATRDTADDGGVFGYGIDCYGSADCVITGNVIYNPANHGIYIHTSTEGGAFAPERNTVTGNTIYQPRDRSASAVTPGKGDGIQVYATADDQIHDLVVANNAIYDPAGNGIYVGNGVNRCVYSANLIYSAGDDGIQMAGSASGLPYRSTVTGNVIRSCGRYGINITHASSGEIFVAANYLMGNSSGDVNVATMTANMVGLNANDAGTSFNFFSPQRIVGTGGNGYVELLEQSADPAAAAANCGRLFTKDNGAGKTQLAVRFNTGAIQVIATQP